MKISGFTMGKNVSKLYYPIKQAIESILPICDEFVVALGDSDADDTDYYTGDSDVASDSFYYRDEFANGHWMSEDSIDGQLAYDDWD